MSAPLEKKPGEVIGQTLSPSKVEQLQSPVGLIAGSGAFPLALAKNARKHGLRLVVVAIKGETDSALLEFCDSCAWVHPGQLGKMIRTFVSSGVKQVAMVGGVSKARLLTGFRLDWRAARFFARVGSMKDDVLLRAFAAEFEKEGMKVISPVLLLPEAIVSAGCLTARGLSKQERKDAHIGWKVAETIGKHDIGQTVVVHRGCVIAVEGVEGTDSTLERAGKLIHGSGGVVVKLVKPQQDIRMDLPAVGVSTIERMLDCGLAALVLREKGALMLDPDQVVLRANAGKVAIEAFTGAGIVA